MVNHKNFSSKIKNLTLEYSACLSLTDRVNKQITNYPVVGKRKHSMSSPSWYHWNNSSQSDDNCHWVITIFSHSCCHYHCHRNHHCHCQISCCSPVVLGHQDYCQRKNKNKTVGYSHQFTLILLRTNWFSQEKKRKNF